MESHFAQFYSDFTFCCTRVHVKDFFICWALWIDLFYKRFSPSFPAVFHLAPRHYWKCQNPIFPQNQFLIKLHSTLVLKKEGIKRQCKHKHEIFLFEFFSIILYLQTKKINFSSSCQFRETFIFPRLWGFSYLHDFFNMHITDIKYEEREPACKYTVNLCLYAEEGLIIIIYILIYDIFVLSTRW